MDINQYMSMFLEESREHLQTLNRCLLELEQEPDNLHLLDKIFRSAHTIKGMSATMGFSDIAELTHEMENILELLRKMQLVANEDILDTLFQCVDTLEQLVEIVTTGGESTIDIKALIVKISALSKMDKADSVPTSPSSFPPAVRTQVSSIQFNETEACLLDSADRQGIAAFEVHVSLQEGCMLKSARSYIVVKALEELGEIIKTIPPIEELEKENFDLDFQLVVVTEADAATIQQTVISVSEVDSVAVLPCTIPEQIQSVQMTSEKPSAKSIDHPVTIAEKIPLRQARVSADKKVKGGQSVRVDIDKLDTLLNLVGELVINKTRLEQIGLTHRLTDLVETIEQMDRVTTDLQTVVMKVRMVPVGQVFNRFPRMVRDLARDLHKEVNLIIQGEETELDRTVIDEIGDPLVHLLRNAIDHGIESPADRQAKGKNPVGEIKLIASHEGNNVIIVVADDGKGINPEIIKSKAVQKGVITQTEADKLDTAEAVRLVFALGFSTAETVTDISGRGVGMDAVKTKIESLGGMVNVETKVNGGSKFTIRLPLTLAIIQALLVNVREETYAIPLGSIDSAINIQPSDIKTIQSQEVILLRGQIIPIVRLSNVLSIPRTDGYDQEDLFVVIVHTGAQRTGIIVDTLIGQQEIVIKSLGKLLTGIKVIAGATILGNGQVALILDVASLMQ